MISKAISIYPFLGSRVRYWVCFFGILFIGLPLSAQDVEFADVIQIGGAGDDAGTDLVRDDAGNLYVTGYFSGQNVDFDPGEETHNLSSAGGTDVFVVKYGPDGDFLWAVRTGGAGDDGSTGIAVDPTGNVYVIGYFSGDVDFNPGAGTFPLSDQGNDRAFFVQKLDTTGSFVWARGVVGPTDLDGSDIAVDTAGSVFATGRFSGTVDFDPGNLGGELVSSGETDIFYLRLSVSGGFEWAVKSGGFSDDRGTSIALDMSGNVYATGLYDGYSDGVTGYYADGFIEKRDGNGEPVWLKKSDTSFTYTIGNAIALDGAGVKKLL